jgi:hypothetical protein
MKKTKVSKEKKNNNKEIIKNADIYVFLFMAYLMTLSVAQTIQPER